MPWFIVEVTDDNDNEERFAIEADSENEAEHKGVERFRRMYPSSDPWLIDLPSRVSVPPTIEATAIHETGHAVCAFVLGFVVNGVSVWEEENGLYRGNMSSNAYEKPYQHGIVLAAGAAAEKHMYGAYDDSSCFSDRMNIDTLGVGLTWDEAFQEAQKIVEANWEAVLKFAKVLQERQIIVNAMPALDEIVEYVPDQGE